MRILNIVGSMDRGGVETWLMHVLRNIDRTRFRMDFLVHTEEPKAFDDEILSLGCTLLRAPETTGRLQHFGRVRSLLRAEPKYDAVHVHMHHFSGVPLVLACLCGITTRIVTSYSDTRFRDASAGLARRAYLASMRFLINRLSTHRFAVSQESAEALYGAGEDVQIFRMGVDTSPFEKAVGLVEVRKSLGIRHGAYVVGHVGRFVEPKNHMFILEIAKALHDTTNDIRFLLVGDGPLRAQIETEIRNAGLGDVVILAGERSDVPKIMMGAMDVFILPSLWEGFPIVAIEAQFAGLPCLLSSRVTRDASIDEDRVTFLEIDSPAQWAMQISGIRSTANVIRAGRSLKESPFNIRNAVAHLAECYMSAIRSRPAHEEREP